MFSSKGRRKLAAQSWAGSQPQKGEARSGKSYPQCWAAHWIRSAVGPCLQEKKLKKRKIDRSLLIESPRGPTGHSRSRKHQHQQQITKWWSIDEMRGKSLCGFLVWSPYCWNPPSPPPLPGAVEASCRAPSPNFRGKTLNDSSIIHPAHISEKL